ncbi:hypothetical protein ACJBU6_08614 [Exserohilum turcicum]
MAMCTHATDNQLLLAISNHNAGSFHVHRIIVCPQSKVLHKACTAGFKEEFTGTIQIDHVHHVELEKLVDFFYSSEYDDCLPEEADVSLLQLHARMFALADQYDIPGLSHLAVEKYFSRCTTSWEPLEFLVSLKDVMKPPPLVLDCYATQPAQLSESICQVCLTTRMLQKCTTRFSLKHLTSPRTY